MESNSRGSTVDDIHEPRVPPVSAIAERKAAGNDFAGGYGVDDDVEKKIQHVLSARYDRRLNTVYVLNTKTTVSLTQQAQSTHMEAAHVAAWTTHRRPAVQANMRATYITKNAGARRTADALQQPRRPRAGLRARAQSAASLEHSLRARATL